MPRRSPRSKIARSRALIAKQEAIGLNRSPTANSAAPPGRPIFCASSTASRPSSATARSRSRAGRSRSNGSRASRKSLGASPVIRRSRTGSSSPTTRSRPRRSRSPPRPRCISARAAPPCRKRSIPTWRTSIATSARSTPRWCAASPTPAAAISSSTRSTSPICAIPSLREHVKARGDDPDTLPLTYARHDQCGDFGYSRPT